MKRELRGKSSKKEKNERVLPKFCEKRVCGVGCFVRVNQNKSEHLLKRTSGTIGVPPP